MRRFFPALGLVGIALSGVALAACGRAHAAAAVAAAPLSAAAAPAATNASAATNALVVRRGDLQPVLLLTGHLRAARAVALVTPRTSSFELQLTWLGEDGASVAAGQPVAQFDNSAFVTDIEQKRSTLTTAAAELSRIESDGKAQLADKAFDIESKQRDLAKARIEAAVPADLLSAHDYQDRQLKLATARAELVKAQEELASARTGAAADIAVQRIALDKARRELAATEAGFSSLTLRAPQAGTLVISDHPWNGLKIEVGDKLYPGETVATLPELASLEVEAALSDVDDGRVTPGLAATCYLDAFPEVAHAARVAEVAAVARESGRTALLRYVPLRVTLAPWSAADLARLRPGMSVRVEVALPAVRGAVLVPRAALDLAITPPRALLADGGAATVRLGACDAFWCVAQSGVTPGQALRRLALPGAG